MINVGVALSIQNIGNIQFQGSGVLMHRSISDDVYDYDFESFGEEDNIPYFESSTKLVCTNSSGFAFKWIDNLLLKNIAILNCGSYSSWTLTHATVHMVNIQNLTVDGLTIRNSTGYGLVGVNVLGISMITKSSFVGSNQCVRNVRQGSIEKSSDETPGNGNYNLNCPILGGNLVLQYIDVDRDGIVKTSDFLTILDGLFTLGFDADNKTKKPVIYRNSIAPLTGSGLAILFYQHTFKISVIINDSISYRNHGQDGSNFKFISKTTLQSLNMHNISSNKGEANGVDGVGISYWLILRGEKGSMVDRTFSITDSKFRNCNIFIELFSDDTSGTNSSFSIHNCLFFNTKIIIESTPKPKYLHRRQDHAGFDHVVMQNSFLQIAHIANIVLECINTLKSSIFINNSNTNIIGSHSYLGSNNSAPLNFSLSEVTINGNVHISNCSSITGGAIYMESSSRLYIGAMSNVTIYNNKAHFHGGAIYMKSNSSIAVSLNSMLMLINNKAGRSGGAIYMHDSLLNVSGRSFILFTGNLAFNSGGAINMNARSTLEIDQQSKLSFNKNVAYLTGGAIYVQDLPLDYNFNVENGCFLLAKNLSSGIIYFEGNYAEEGGSVLYGGNIESCGRDANMFSNIAKIGYHDNSTSIISSDPKYICPCNETATGIDTYQCSITSFNRTLYPGQSMLVKFITVGQMGGASPAIVLNYRAGDDGIFFASAMRSSKICEEHKIPFGLVNSSQYLVTETSFSTGDIFQLKSYFNIAVAILPCPVGFVLCTVSMVCICDPLLTKSGLTCNITDVTVRGTQNMWIGYTSQHVLGFCTVCPYDYCTEAAEVNVLDLDSQCGYGRHRVLCGQCKDGLSMNFGTSQCKVCTNYYLFMIVPFAIMGITLVLVLFLLNLTVTSGTLNGLLFYANIVRINDSTFFPKAKRHFAASFLATFVAWLNLDFGIETCFYNGMGSYAKIWLQFAFPAYIFALLGTIIIAGRCSSKISRLCRHHAIPVLSTLILLSYSKMLKTIITIFSFAVIKTDVNSTGDSLVWLYDGNIEFLGPKHIILFTFGLLVIFTFIVPYTTMLLFLPCLQSKSYIKALIWVNKLKPFLDSYAAPYKDRYRFWVGVLLLVRLPLYLLFSSTNNISVHLLGILIFVYIYSMFLIRLTVYKKWTTFAIDLFFQLNIISISTARLFDHGKSINEPIASIVLVGVASAMLCLVLIVVTHIYLRVKVLPSWNMCQYISTYWKGNGSYNSAGLETTCKSSSVNNNYFNDELRETT